MRIVLEGPDGSGKSTLARHIVNVIGLQIKTSEGPEKYPGEIIERIERYFRMNNVLFDRHPVVSQEIYGQFVPGFKPLPYSYIKSFYFSHPIRVFCYGRAGAHEVKAHDSPEHLKMIEENDNQIQKLYYRWASRYATHRYTIGDSISDLIEQLKRDLDR